MYQRTTIENGNMETFVDFEGLRQADFDLPSLRRHARAVEEALARLCEAYEQPISETSGERAQSAYRAVCALAHLLEPASCEDPRTGDKLKLTRDAIAALENALAALVEQTSRADRGERGDRADLAHVALRPGA